MKKFAKDLITGDVISVSQIADDQIIKKFHTVISIKPLVVSTGAISPFALQIETLEDILYLFYSHECDVI